MEEGANKAAASPAIDESKFTNKVAITILKGASTQGNPSYDPDTSKGKHRCTRYIGLMPM